jgi:hypothetical protein
LERQRDRGGAGYQHQQCRSNSAATRRGGVRVDAEAQIQPELRPAADFRRGGGGETDRSDLLAGSRGLRPLEPTPARPPDANAGFVAALEDVLETYQKPRDPDRPLVCLDETSKQLIVGTRAPIPAKLGQPARHDYEYERNGVANLFMMFAPLEGWRHVKVTDHHAAVDYAQSAEGTVGPAFSRRRQNRPGPRQSQHPTRPPRSTRPSPAPEWHYAPEHGSWLDMAESELAVLTNQCLSRVRGVPFPDCSICDSDKPKLFG